MPDSTTASSDDIVDLSPADPTPIGVDPDDGVETGLRDNVVLLLPGTDTARQALDQPLTVRLREALDASNELILVIEPSGRVLFANRQAREQLFGDETDPVFRAVEPLLTGARRDEVWRALERDCRHLR